MEIKKCVGIAFYLFSFQSDVKSTNVFYLGRSPGVRHEARGSSQFVMVKKVVMLFAAVHRHHDR
jgi:hypothetical protein